MVPNTPQTENEHEETVQRVQTILDQFQKQYQSAGKKKLIAFTKGQLIEAEKQAGIQQTIFKARELVRKHLGHYLPKPTPVLQPCGVCGRLTPRSELIDACCRLCKRHA